jgi:hypothetical protein
VTAWKREDLTSYLLQWRLKVDGELRSADSEEKLQAFEKRWQRAQVSERLTEEEFFDKLTPGAKKVIVDHLVNYASLAADYWRKAESALSEQDG